MPQYSGMLFFCPESTALQKNSYFCGVFGSVPAAICRCGLKGNQVQILNSPATVSPLMDFRKLQPLTI